jgi:GNAT superfamily N-acetyltransferase
MTTQDVYIRRVRISELRDFVRDAIVAAGLHGLVPITPQRAVAHATNPYADGDDVALLVAYCQNECVGYLGILPGRLKTATGMHKVYWASTWYADPRYRRSGIALRLIQEARSLSYDLIAADANDVAQSMYRALKFKEFGPLTYCHARLQLDGERSLLSVPFRVVRRALVNVGFHAAWIDRVIEGADSLRSSIRRAFLYRRFAKRTAGALHGVRYELRHEPFPLGSLPPFPHNSSPEELPRFYRGLDAIDWMLRYKWVLSDHEGPSERVQYVFSNIRNTFTFVQLSLFSRSTSDQIGFVILSLSRPSANTPRVVKVLDSYITSAIAQDVLIAVVVRAAARLRADTIVLPDQLVLPLLNGGRDELRVERVRRPYFCMSANLGSPLTTAMQSLVLNYCDGDAAFV